MQQLEIHPLHHSSTIQFAPVTALHSDGSGDHCILLITAL